MAGEFRFGVNMITPGGADEWRAKCRRAEELGFDVILVADHLGMPSPFPALVAAAEATRRPRVGTFVLNAGFWNPALLAREVATTDALTGGRLELGLGTGYVRAEHDTAGLPWGSPGQRVDHLRHVVEELDRLFDSAEYRPRPVQRPRPPLLIGGNGNRVLGLAAERADTTAFTGARSVPGDKDGRLQHITPEELDERVAFHGGAAADRETPPELNLLVQLVAVTDDRRAGIQSFKEHLPDLGEEEILALPLLLVGTVREIADQVRAQRERYGFTYITVLEPYLEMFGAVIKELRTG
ncbi:LLM class F420-dependent oxidoreductase [Streptomyces tsukubensis]|uniref:F420-dependent oxidoreductase n=1 Tax=Streptomyces tsukubensis TaxID=83656 RepID=A0A1V4A6X0_9ACTN|nr:LLM class F420-dependent oxidoreductase [Streptomyces tsukubensis]OON77329.1 F420-dependent oxidoreductase [Streptomyces tsukubensis]QFR92406.1 TIGR03621 family F420-dependent LLM class oxidoreductase [Streptomyces tsukubensis]